MKVFALAALCVNLAFSFGISARMLPYFVSTQWLSEHLNDKDLVVLQVGFSRGEFRLGHIPNAQFLWFNALAPSNPDLSTEMPSVDEARKVLEELGISDRSSIVLVFTGSNVTITTRMYLALSYFGFAQRTTFLDGGYEAWKKENRPVEKGLPEIKKTSLKLMVHPEVIVDADWVKRNLSDPKVTIVDARTKTFYDGNGGGVARQGHIKGAKHLVYSSMLDSTGKIKSKNELQHLFDSAGVVKGTTVVSYCHVGQQATLVYYAAKYLGYDAKVYDGCFEDWNVRDESFPVEKSGTKME